MDDTYPIRLPSGGKVLLIVPDTFTLADAEHVKRWVDLVAAHSEPQGESEKGNDDQAA